MSEIHEYSHLRPFATVRQHEVLDALEKHNSVRGAARELGVERQTIQCAIVGLKARAAKQGIGPEYDMTHEVAPGYQVKGVSTYYDDSGAVRGQWVKTTADSKTSEELKQAFLQAFQDEIPKVDPVAFDGKCEDSLLNVYVYGDPHIGLRTWEDETGQNHDLEMAEQLFMQAHSDLVARSPAASTAVILNLGDYFHADDGRNVTLKSGHPLDLGDGRYQKVRKTGFKILRYMVDLCLRKHGKVIIWNVQGNHDEYSSVDLSLWLDVAYENEPRVEVNTSPSKFYYFQHGAVMLAASHGDTIKPDQMLGIMAADQPSMWGSTKFRFAHLGHVHHKMLRDLPGVAVETHRVLQPNDLYAHSHGYRSQRDAQCITYHNERGEYSRVMVNPSVVG